MKAVKIFNIIGLIFLNVLLFSAAASAQTEDAVTVKTSEKAQTGDRTKTDAKTDAKDDEEKDQPSATPEDPADEKEVEDAILPYYVNYLKEYRIGPNDVISVEVFGQCPDYCKTGISVPPTARISYPLIREGVFVGGKTVEEIADEITKKLDEYIIDPKVTVTLERAMSARYSVLGKVASPGVRVLDRKVSVYEAVVEAGGVLKDGDKKRVVIYSYDAQGRITPKIIDLTAIERGKADMVYLNPGDQVFIPDRGFRLNMETVFDVLSKASIVRLLFGSPF
jgi:polysaccharide export outer membrane protein